MLIVPNEDARQSLSDELKDNLVLTIYESKGLEFDDVLIFNFFERSKCGKDWRVVTSYLNAIIESQKEESNMKAKLTESTLVKSGKTKITRDEGAP